MFSVAVEQKFCVNLKDASRGYFSIDSSPTGGFGSSARFIGDQPNAAIRYIADTDQMLSTDWPLVLTGPSGTGKSMLATHVAADLVSKTGGSEAIFWTATEFARRFQAACETDSSTEWRQRFVDTACFVIDHLDDLETHPHSQQELVQILDLLGNKHIPFVCTISQQFLQSDDLLSQLGSRLSGGLCLVLKAPGLQARREIIRSISVESKLNLSDEAIEYVAQQMNVTAPKIRHFLGQFATWLSANESAPVIADIIWVQQFHKHFLADSSKSHSELIVRCVAAAFKLKPREVKSSSRKQTIVLARAIAIYLQRKLLRLSFSKIGSNFGGRDHSTIVHANKKIEKIVCSASANDDDSRYLILQLEQQITEQMAVGPKGPC